MLMNTKEVRWSHQCSHQSKKFCKRTVGGGFSTCAFALIIGNKKQVIALTRGLTQSCAICHQTYQYSYSRSTKDVNTKLSNSKSNSIMHVKTNKWGSQSQSRSQSQSQTILCCSHVIHTNYLASFERFVGFENRFFPLCSGGVGWYSKMLKEVGKCSCDCAKDREGLVLYRTN